ncbi:MAG TPA: efflux RND transporter periplasmic adaptor subunit [Vicinamibacterales bacterium]|nr:efflux RND transporter periplasmic adaptor subunit [Vicinamibacterales bacterium]
MTLRIPFFASALVAGVLACSEAPARESANVAPEVDPRLQVIARDTIIADVLEAPARSEPFLAATLSTKLMAHVKAVRAREGDRVSQGTVLVELDARDIAAKQDQADAALRSAEAAHNQAQLNASRMRALFADSAAPRAHLDAAEAALVGASEAVRAARAGVTEVETLAEDATLRAPFPAVVVQRFVDAGSFVAPGSPLLRIEDPSRLRVVASMTPGDAARLSRDMAIDVRVEGVPVRGRIEGIVPAPGAALVLVQALVDNPGARFSSGSAATIAIPMGRRHAILVPSEAVFTVGDLTGVRVRSGKDVITRWIRAGRRHGDAVEVLSGVAPGDTLVMSGLPDGV